MTRKRLDPEQRFNEIVKAALKLAERAHYLNLKPSSIARAAGCSRALVTHYLGSGMVLTVTILREAIKRKNRKVITQAQDTEAITLTGDLCAAASVLEYRCVE